MRFLTAMLLLAIFLVSGSSQAEGLGRLFSLQNSVRNLKPISHAMQAVKMLRHLY